MSGIISKLKASYKKTDRMLQIIDAMLVTIMLTGIVQFIYVLIVGTFPC